MIVITLSNKALEDQILRWRALSQVSLSDYHYKEFRLGVEVVFMPPGRNSRSVYWTRYAELLKERISLKTIESIEKAAKKLGRALKKCFEIVCPERKIREGKVIPCWSTELSRHRKQSRKLLN